MIWRSLKGYPVRAKCADTVQESVDSGVSAKTVIIWGRKSF